MSYAVAIVKDDTFEEPLVVVGSSTEQLARLVCDYLRIARPLTAPEGLRLEVPIAIEGPWYDWMWMHLEDVEDITVHMYDTVTKDLMTAGGFRHFITQHAEEIAKQHTPLVEDVIYLDERYRM